jgi:hypothetical protein
MYALSRRPCTMRLRVRGVPWQTANPADGLQQQQKMHWDAATERRDAQDELHSTGTGGGVDADRDFGLDGVGRSAP